MTPCSKIFTLLLPLLIAVPAAAQTYIGPAVGIHFAHIEGYDTQKFPIYNVTTEPGFGIISPFAGLRIDQHLTNRLFVSSTSGYTQKTVKYFDMGFVGYTDMRFNQLVHSLTLNMCLTKNWHVGFGGHFNHLFELELGKKRIDFWSSQGTEYNVGQLGWVFSSSFAYRRFMLDIRFYQSERTFAKFEHFIKSTSAIEVALIYRFKVFGKESKN